MARIAKVLATLLLAHGFWGRADTLSLRNGTTVTGSWAGADAEQIRFLVQDQIQTYPRSDVSAVTFGDKQPKSQPPPAARISIGMSMDEVTAALGQPDKIADLDARKIYFYKDLKVTFADGKVCEIYAAAASSAGPGASAPTAEKVIEPELIGVVYLQDEAGKLIPLMRIHGQVETPKGPLGIPVGNTHRVFESTPSTVRVKSGQKLLFVVKLANGIDPGSLYLLGRKLSKSGDKHPSSPIHFNIAKFGQSSYALTPTVDLAPGEYAFYGHGSNDLYCFGVDEAGDAKAATGAKDGGK